MLVVYVRAVLVDGFTMFTWFILSNMCFLNLLLFSLFGLWVCFGLGCLLVIVGLFRLF